MSKHIVRDQRLIPARAGDLFNIVADPSQHALLDGSGSVRASHSSNPERLSAGATFTMDMKIGAKYRMKNTVTEFDEGRLIGWRPASGHTWRYRFEPVDGGTRVTEEWDVSTAKRAPARMLPLLGFRRRNRRGIAASLERLETLAATG